MILIAFHVFVLKGYLAFKVYEGSKIVKTKIKSEEQERIERMEHDLEQWKKEDQEKVSNQKN